MPDGYYGGHTKHAPSIGLISDGDDFIPKSSAIAELLDKTLKIAFPPPKSPVAGYREPDASMTGSRIGIRYPCDKEVNLLSRRDAYHYLHWLNHGGRGTFAQFQNELLTVTPPPAKSVPVDKLQMENKKLRRTLERIRTIGYGAAIKYGDDHARDQMATLAGEALLG